MRNFIFAMILICTNGAIVAQKTVMPTEVKMMDSTKMDNHCLYCNLVTGGAKYLFNSAKNTRTTLAASGFNLDETAVEYYVKYKDLPKLFYFQQLGSLLNAKYASINGFGVKQDIRWNLLKSSKIMLAPYGELGVGYYRLSTIEGLEKPSIVTALNNDETQQKIFDNITVTGDVGLDLGFGFNFEKRRLMLVLNGGFMTNFPTQWRNSGSLAFSEKLNILSPYAGLSLKLDMFCPDGCCK